MTQKENKQIVQQDGLQHNQLTNNNEEQCNSEEENKVLLRQLKKDIPTCCWGGGIPDDWDIIQLRKAKETTVCTKRGAQHLEGREHVNISLVHPQIYIDPIRALFNGRGWKKRQDDVLQIQPSNTASFLKCVVNLELTTGINRGDCEGRKLSWGQKAKRLADYLKALARILAVLRNTTPMSFRKAMGPTVNATSIAPLGGP